jgi:polyhydroxybutyrate depolymerase
MLVDGTDDPINPGWRRDAVRVWQSRESHVREGLRANIRRTERDYDRARDRADGASKARRPTSVEILTWSARGKPISRLYTVHGGGHVIPQPVFRFPRLFGKSTSALDAPSAAMEFFAQ